MTLKRSFSKSKQNQNAGPSMPKLVWHFVQKNLWLPALYALYFFFQEPVLMLLTWNARLSVERITNAVNATWSSPFLLLVPLGGAVVTGLVYYAYLHSKKKIDLYHSISVKREKLFTAVFIAAFAAYFVPYLFMVLLKILAAVAVGAGFVLMWSALVKFVLYAMLFYAVALGLTALSSQLAGRLITSLCMTAYLMFLPLMVYGAWMLLMDRFFVTYTSAVYDDLWLMSRLCMPVRIGAMESYPMDTAWVLGYVAAAVIIFGLGLLAAVRRPSESAGKSAAFGFVEWFVRYPLVVIGTFLFAEFMYTLNDRVFWYVFGLVMGALMTNCILNIIIKGNLRDFFCNKKGFAIVCAFMGAVLLGCIFQPFGYDEYLPREGKVEAVRFHLSDLHNAQDRTNFNTMYLNNEYRVGRYNYDAMDKAYRDPAVIGAVLELAGYCVESLEDKGSGFAEDWDYYIEYSKENGTRRSIYLQLEYELRSGRKVTRYYRVCDEAAYEACLKNLWDLESIRMDNDILFDEGIDWSTFRAYAGDGYRNRSGAYDLVHEEWNDDGNYVLSLTPSAIPDSETAMLVEALKEDLANRTYDRLQSARNVGWLYLMKLVDNGGFDYVNRDKGAIWTRVELLDTDVRTLSILRQLTGDDYGHRVNIDPNDEIEVTVTDLNLFREAGIEPGIAEITAMGGKAEGSAVSNIYYTCWLDYADLAPYMNDLYDDNMRSSGNPFLRMEEGLLIKVIHRENVFDPETVGTKEWAAGVYDQQVYDYYEMYVGSAATKEVIYMDGAEEYFYFRDGQVPAMLMRAVYNEVVKSIA